MSYDMYAVIIPYETYADLDIVTITQCPLTVTKSEYILLIRLFSVQLALFE